jgi:hypothetical protein
VNKTRIDKNERKKILRDDFLWVNNEPIELDAFRFKASAVWKTNSRKFVLHSFLALVVFEANDEFNPKTQVKSEKAFGWLENRSEEKKTKPLWLAHKTHVARS